MREYKVELVDGADPRNVESLEVSIQVRSDPCLEYPSICIVPKGFGDNLSEDGEGAPIMLEMRKGKLHLIIWDDINEEQNSHNISLEGARESRRK